MARKKKKVDTSPTGFPQKSWDKLSETWREAAQTKTTDELEKDLIVAVRAMADTTAYMKDDSKLAALQEEVKDLKSGYTETIAAEKAIQVYYDKEMEHAAQ